MNAIKRSAADVIVLALIAAGVVFRFIRLVNTPGLNGDEAFYGYQAVRPIQDVEWRTPNENPLNPVPAILEFLLNLVFKPDVWVLRLPAVLAGVGCIFLAWSLWKSVLPRASARSAALLLATMPVAIAFSRMGWNPWDSVPACVLVISASLAGKPIWTAAALFLAVWIHPTDIFLVPMIGAHWIVRLWTGSPSPAERNRRLMVFTAVSGAVLVILKLAFLSTSRAQAKPEFFNFSQWMRFDRFFAELLSGTSAYRYIVGPVGTTTEVWHLALFAVLFVPVLLAGTVVLIRWRSWRELSHVAGTALSFAAYGILAARRAMESPGDMRYAFVLIAPSVLAWLMCVDAVLPSVRLSRLAHDLAIPAIGTAYLASFWFHYFQRIEVTGGEADIAFRTAQVEPRQVAADSVREQSRTCSRTVVSAESFWIAEPLKYFLAKDAGMAVYLAGEVPDGAMQNIPLGCVFAVSFAGAQMERAMRGGGLTPMVIRDARNRPFMEVWRLGARP